MMPYAENKHNFTSDLQT